MNSKKLGVVYLVGAGPGDPELITIKALKVLQKANIIFYDSLLNKEILDNSQEHCEKIFVGKRLGVHSLEQSEINKLLYKNAIQKKVVVRLKGGDPFIFGRGGEEITFLEDRNISVEVIPGITAAVAASASLKVPLTHRDFGKSVIFLSGYTKDKGETNHLPVYDWNFFATSSLTMIFYMGLKNIKEIAQNLIDNKKSPETEVAIISDCTMPDEKTFITTLGNIIKDIDLSEIKFPSIILIGDVINHGAKSIKRLLYLK